MKKGDIVKVNDGSWSVEIKNGKLEDTCGLSLQGGFWEVIATNCDLPTDDDGKEMKERNDTILRALDDNTIVFIQERMLSLKHHCNRCPYCGKIIPQK